MTRICGIGGSRVLWRWAVPRRIVQNRSPTFCNNAAMRSQKSVIPATNRSEGRKNSRKSRKKIRPAVHIIIIGYFIGVRALFSLLLLYSYLQSSSPGHIYQSISSCLLFFVHFFSQPLRTITYAEGKATWHGIPFHYRSCTDCSWRWRGFFPLPELGSLTNSLCLFPLLFLNFPVSYLFKPFMYPPLVFLFICFFSSARVYWVIYYTSQAPGIEKKQLEWR